MKPTASLFFWFSMAALLMVALQRCASAGDFHPAGLPNGSAREAERKKLLIKSLVASPQNFDFDGTNCSFKDVWIQRTQYGTSATLLCFRLHGFERRNPITGFERSNLDFRLEPYSGRKSGFADGRWPDSRNSGWFDGRCIHYFTIPDENPIPPTFLLSFFGKDDYERKSEKQPIAQFELTEQ